MKNHSALKNAVYLKLGKSLAGFCILVVADEEKEMEKYFSLTS